MRRRHVALFAIASLLFAACGNGDDAEPDAAGPTEAAPAEAAPTDEGPTDEGPTAAGPTEAAAGDANLEEMAAAAQEEGQLVWYNSGPPDQANAVISAFGEEYGLETEMIRLTTGPLSERYASEVEAGSVFADLITVGNPVFFDAGTEAGWFAEISEEEIPNLANLSDPELYFRNGTTVTGGTALVSMAYNTDLVAEEEAPENFEDLLDPQWRGELIIGDPQGVPVWLLTNWFFHETFGPDFLEGLREQEFTVIDSVIPGGQAVAAGEYAILPYTLKGNHDELIEQGAPITYVDPPVTTGMPYEWAISADAPHPNAARLFMNYMLSMEGQNIYNNGSGVAIMPDVPNAFEPPEEFFPPEVSTALENEDMLIELLGL